MAPRVDILKMFAMFLLGTAFIGSVIVMVIDAIVQPDKMPPTFIQTIVGIGIGISAGILGFQLGGFQAIQISQHTADTIQGKSDMPPQA